MSLEIPTAAAAPRPAAPTPAAARAEDAGDRAALASDFQTFLSLLTAQMRNQDPLKPIESTEFVAQLASFSTVEQQIRANDRLDAIHDALTRGEGAGLAEWIGREVRTAEVLRREAGARAEVEVAPLTGAERAELIALDETGAEIGRVAADPAADRLTWPGRTAAGDAPAGRHRYEVEYFAEDRSLGRIRGEVAAEVTELRLGGAEGPRLLLAGGGEIAPEDVSAVRATPAEG